jgi:hypothetical protein
LIVLRFFCENLLFFSAAKRKVAKESAAPAPNAPQGQGVALRCYRTAMVNWVALVFLPVSGDY